MNLQEFKERFWYELKNGLDHAEWYELEIKWLIAQVEKQQKEIQKLKNK